MKFHTSGPDDQAGFLSYIDTLAQLIDSTSWTDSQMIEQGSQIAFVTVTLPVTEFLKYFAAQIENKYHLPKNCQQNINLLVRIHPDTR